jgi:hypothetical protein
MNDKFNIKKEINFIHKFDFINQNLVVAEEAVRMILVP